MTAPRVRTAPRRTRVLTAGALALTAAGVMLAVLQPAWLTDPLRAAVADAGTAAPIVYVVLCVVAAPLHLSGVLVALSLLIWPLPVAASLSFVGGVTGCLLTAAALSWAGAGRAQERDGWPAWLERLADRVARRPLLVGTAVRVVLQSGVVVEAFYLLTGYSRRHYLAATLVGYALYLAQAVLGITALTALVEVSPWLGGLFVVLPILTLVAAAVIRRRRARSTDVAT